MEQSLRKTVRSFLKRLKIKKYDSAVPFLGIYPEKQKHKRRYLQYGEATRVPINR